MCTTASDAEVLSALAWQGNMQLNERRGPRQTPPLTAQDRCLTTGTAEAECDRESRAHISTTDKDVGAAATNMTDTVMRVCAWAW